MDQEAVLAAFDEQIRRHAGPPGPDEVVEREDAVVRIISDGWGGVTWSDLDPSTADSVIAAQVDRFAQLARPWNGSTTATTSRQICPRGLSRRD
jgi:hypothetical protein